MPFIDDDDPEIRAAKAEYEEKRKHNGSHGGLSPRTLMGGAIAALTDPDYIVKGIINQGALVEFYGPAKSGKSFAALDLALHVAAGRPWFGRRVHRCGVLYISAEGGTSIKKRLAAACERLKINLDEIDFGAVIAPTNLLDPNGIDQLIADARAVPNVGLIIIDTASRVMPGGKEDTEAMSLFVSACDIVRSVVGAAILVIHHTGKDQNRGSRGGSGLPAAADAVAAFSQEGKIRSIELANARDGEIGPIGSFVLGVVDLDIDADGDPITSCVVEPCGTIEPSATLKPKPKTKLIPRDQIALDALRQALGAHGAPAPAHNYIEPGVTVVSLDLWRRFYLASTSGNNDISENGQRKAFNRAKESLQSKSITRAWDQMVWQL